MVEDTNQHELTHTLTEPQMVAVVMRTQGATYQDVSKVLDTPVDTVKNWFRPNSTVRAVYDEYSFQVTTQIGSDALNRMETMVDDAVSIMYELMASPNSSEHTKFRAAAYIIDKVSPMILEKVEIIQQAKAIQVGLESGLRHEEVIESSENVSRYTNAYRKVVMK